MVYTKEMIKAMSNAEKQRVKSMLIELAIRAKNLTKKDIATWRTAWQMAINPENPRRGRLYDVYTDVDIDLHLTGAIGQRKGFVTKKSFKLVDKQGKENTEVSTLFETEWFEDFCSMVLDSRYWGHSLIQMGDILSTNGKKKFHNVTLVPRQHVIPEYGVILRDASDDIRKGIDYRTGKIADWVIEAGGTHDLGLLLKCSPHALSKKNMLGFWDAFGEMFGMPIRIGKTTSRDKKEIDKVENMLSEMGAAAWGLFPEGTEIEIKETTRGDAYNVYDKRIERANSELSKGILNQTMTIDNGSSQSQSEVHLEVLENVIEADAKFLKGVINGKLIPLMARHGFPVEGYRFEYDQSIDYTPDEQIRIEQMLLNAGYEIEPNFFAEKYNIKITGKKKQETTPPLANDFFA